MLRIMINKLAFGFAVAVALTLGHTYVHNGIISIQCLAKSWFFHFSILAFSVREGSWERTRKHQGAYQWGAPGRTNRVHHSGAPVGCTRTHQDASVGYTSRALQDAPGRTSGMHQDAPGRTSRVPQMSAPGRTRSYTFAIECSLKHDWWFNPNVKYMATCVSKHTLQSWIIMLLF